MKNINMKSILALVLVLGVVVMPFAGYTASIEKPSEEVRINQKTPIQTSTPVSKPVISNPISHSSNLNLILAQDDAYFTGKNIILMVKAPGILSNDVFTGHPVGIVAKLHTEISKGFIELKENGSFIYTPEKDFVGEVVFEYQVSDGVKSDIAKVIITISNDAPNAQEDKYKVETGETLEGKVLINDVDPNGDDLEAVYIRPEGSNPDSIGNQPGFPIKLEFGILKEFNSNGIFVYDSNEKAGQDQFIYQVFDGQDYSEETSVIIDVYETPPTPNIVPIANAGADQTVDEGVLVTLDASASSDADLLDTLTYSWIAPAGIVLSNSMVANPTFTAPGVPVSTSYTFDLVVSDSKDTDLDTVIITVSNLDIGCTDSSANNYDASATEDDGSCTYPSSGGGGGGGTTPRCNPSNVTNGVVASYPTCTITCNDGYVLEDNSCVVLVTEEETTEEGVIEEGQVLGEKVFNDGLWRCENHRIYSVQDNMKVYVPDLETLAKNYSGEEINYATCEDIANIPEVLGDNTKEECVADFKTNEGGLFRGTDMRIYAWLDGAAYYVSSLEELARDFWGIEIINICQSVVDSLVK